MWYKLSGLNSLDVH